MSEHTPAPWKVNEENFLVYVEGEEQDYCIADTQNGNTNCVSSPITALNNARLIAAAPELLEMLIEVKEHAQDDSPAMWVIAKAMGESNG